MITTKILLAAATISLIMSGCAQKKVNTSVTGLDGTQSGIVGDYEVINGTDGYVDGTGHYDNVDPYGDGNYGNNGYGNNGGYGNNNGYGNGNGGYADGSKGYGVNGDGIQNLYFDVDQYTITSDKLATVSQNASLLRGDILQGARVKIEGHCDATGSDEYNYALGLRRAKATKDAMISRGINEGSISLVSMGESSPECTTSSSADCYSKNRRVEFKVVQ
jgi:outer membrane protein OmpA-like peptidoglycan-associated protein